MHFSLTFIAIISLINLILGLVIFSRTHKKSYGWYFPIAILGIVLWSVAEILMLGSRDSSVVELAAKIFYIAPTMIPVGILLFSIAFPEGSKVSRYILLTAFGVVASWTIALSINLNLLISNIEITEPLNRVTPHTGSFLFYAAYFSILFMATYLILYKKYQLLKGTQRSQIAYTLFGVIMSSGLGMFTNLALPILGVYGYIWLGPVFTLLYVGSVSYAIIRHRLFDVRLVIARSVAYVLSLGVLVTGYAATTYWLTANLFEGSSGFIKDFSLIVLLVIAAVTYSPIKLYFDKLTNRLFYRDAYDPQSFLDELNTVLVGNIEIGILLRHTSQVIEDNLKAQYCFISIGETDAGPARSIGNTNQKFSQTDLQLSMKQLDRYGQKVVIVDDLEAGQEQLKTLLLKNDVGVAVRLVANFYSKEQTIAYLMLGQKKSGNVYNKQDVRIIDIIADELLIAIQNALRFEEIQEFNATLQKKVNDATSKLQKSNEKLKAMDETKDEFISMASHQLRTPLTSVKGYLSMVLEGDAGKISDSQQQLLNQAFISSQRMVYLIADLLNVSRLKTGKFVINKTPTDLVDMVEGELAQLTEVAKGRKLTLTFNKPDNFPILDLDETKTRQVVMNFVDNAIYYTPAGGTIKIELRTDRSSVYFMVKDDGMGVPKTEQSHLFTKFYRAKNAQKARPDGTGLGLFMAKKVITDQGGSILFESLEGKGSTFGFKFDKPPSK